MEGDHLQMAVSNIEITDESLAVGVNGNRCVPADIVQIIKSVLPPGAAGILIVLEVVIPIVIIIADVRVILGIQGERNISSNVIARV